MASSTPYLWASCTLLVAHILWRKLLWHRRSKGYKLPPSPRRGYPLLGHALDVPRSNEHVVFREWSKELGRDIFYLDAAGTPIVVVNTIELATEMLEKRSRIYSSRPGSIMMNDLMGWGWVISNLPYGEKWKERRKLFQRHFSPANKASHQFCEQEHISKLLVKLLDSPDGFMGHTRHMVGGIAYSIAYGLSVQPNNDPYIQLAEAAIKSAVEAAVPGAFLVDFVPALRYVPEWVPGAGFKKKAREWKRLNNKMRNKPFEEAEAQINEGIARPSFIRKALEDLDTSGNVAHQREVIQDTAGMVFAAAADTTTSALCTFFLAMMCYPKVQKRAQEELDRVLGIGTLPQSEDENRLPYINAIVKEVLRTAQ
ncbi:cytochrome P450 [Coprinopsis cinerea AmutBmut pab1-1]|nr:cytochrome P450 [Coprinopsis cinerea AmutBmut pab1-1]